MEIKNYMEERNPNSLEEAIELVRRSPYDASLKIMYLGDEHFKQYKRKRTD